MRQVMLAMQMPMTRNDVDLSFSGRELKHEHPGGMEGIVGQSKALKSVLHEVSLVAAADSTVLIQGETGTGKELIARAVHNLSDRRNGPFQRINCAAIPRDLLESDLFGHEKGAFTGAVTQKLGRFELAGHGTIFLDEIGEMSLDLQPKLLRVLQEREFERVGSPRMIRMHARVIAATNRNLSAMVGEGKFREDLFYRLSVFPIQVPALRERREDIPLLVKHLVQQFARRMGKTIESVAPETMEALKRYSWPGNIRELQNVIERAVVLSDGGILSVNTDRLKRDSSSAAHPAGPFAASLAHREKEMIEAALAESQGRISGPTGAAAKLGIPRQTLDSKIANLQISKERFKNRGAINYSFSSVELAGL
jgi:formate hydrogenlyase transcriptional activator